MKILYILWYNKNKNFALFFNNILLKYLYFVNYYFIIKSILLMYIFLVQKITSY